MSRYDHYFALDCSDEDLHAKKVMSPGYALWWGPLGHESMILSLNHRMTPSGPIQRCRWLGRSINPTQYSTSDKASAMRSWLATWAHSKDKNPAAKAIQHHYMGDDSIDSYDVQSSNMTSDRSPRLWSEKA